jgi:hypothetical protein
MVSFLGAFANLWKATISFVMSVRLSVRMEQLGAKWMDFHGIRYLSISWNLVFEYFMEFGIWVFHGIWYLSISWNSVFEYFMEFGIWVFHGIWYLSISWNLVFEYFMEFGIWAFLENVSGKFNFHWNLTRIEGYFTWRPIHNFWSYLAQFFLEWEMSQTKFVEKIKTHLISSHFSSKIVPFMR